MNSLRHKIGDHWSNKGLSSSSRLRWWQSPTIIRHVNRIVCGQAIDGFSNGLHELVSECAQGRSPSKTRFPWEWEPV
jgi:hypothetical protein